MLSTSSTPTLQRHPEYPALGHSAPRRFPSTRRPAWHHALIATAYSLPLGFASVYIFIVGMFFLGPLVYVLLAAPLAWLKPIDKKYAGVKGSWARTLLVTFAFWVTTRIAWAIYWTGGAYDQEVIFVLLSGLATIAVGILVVRLVPEARNRRRA